MVEPRIFLDCPSGCVDGEFCGRDNLCHAYSCENWYTLAPATYTGYDPSTSPVLDCTHMDPMQVDRSYRFVNPFCPNGDMPAAVFHRVDKCLGGTVCSRSMLEEGIEHYIPMNRKCTAQPNPETTFVCYEMDQHENVSNVTQALIDNYTDATMGQVNTVPCGANDTDRHSHFYTGLIRYPNNGVFTGPDASEVFDEMALQAAMIATYEVDTPSQFPLCDAIGGCKTTEFCGTDLQCHEFSCDTFYRYGPTVYTGQEEEKEEQQLQCTDTMSSSASAWCDFTGDGFPIAVKYQCLPNGYFVDLPDCPASALQEENLYAGRYTTYNRYCTAQPNPGQQFTCFDMDSMDPELYFQDFVYAVRANDTCTAENNPVPFITDRELAPSILYDSCVGYRNRTGSGFTDCTIFPGGYHQSLLSFDASYAQFTMKSMLETFSTTADDETMAPSQTPTTTTSAAFRSMKGDGGAHGTAVSVFFLFIIATRWCLL